MVPTRAVPAPISSAQDDWSCSISSLGSAWLCSWRTGGLGGCNVWRISAVDGQFKEAANVRVLNAGANDYSPMAGPDEGYVVFNLDRPGGYGGADLDISSPPSRPRSTTPSLQYRFRDPNDRHLYTISGFDPNHALVVGTTCCAETDIVDGRFLQAGAQGKVLLEQAYAQLRQLKVGDTVRVADKAFTVQGIINPGIRPAKADIYMSYPEAEGLVAAQLPDVTASQGTNLILVEVKDSSRQEEAIRDVKSLYPDLVISSYACYRPAAQARQINTAAMGALVVAIGVFTVLLAMASQLAVLVTVPWIISTWLGPLHVAASHVRWPALWGGAILLSMLGGLVAGLLPAIWVSWQRPSRLLRAF